MEEEHSGEEQAGPEIFMDPSQLAGVWANFAQVSHSEHEFTLDFVRIDYTAQPPGRASWWPASPFHPYSLRS